MTKAMLILTLSVYLLLMATTPSHAYLNPDQCSYVVQGALGGIGGLSVVLRYLWRLLRSRSTGASARTPD